MAEAGRAKPKAMAGMDVEETPQHSLAQMFVQEARTVRSRAVAAARRLPKPPALDGVDYPPGADAGTKLVTYLSALDRYLEEIREARLNEDDKLQALIGASIRRLTDAEAPHSLEEGKDFPTPAGGDGGVELDLIALAQAAGTNLELGSPLGAWQTSELARKMHEERRRIGVAATQLITVRCRYKKEAVRCALRADLRSAHQLVPLLAVLKAENPYARQGTFRALCRAALPGLSFVCGVLFPAPAGTEARGDQEWTIVQLGSYPGEVDRHLSAARVLNFSRAAPPQ